MWSGYQDSKYEGACCFFDFSRLFQNEMHALLAYEHFLSAFFLLNKLGIFISPHLGEAKCTYLIPSKMFREE